MYRKRDDRGADGMVTPGNGAEAAAGSGSTSAGF